MNLADIRHLSSKPIASRALGGLHFIADLTLPCGRVPLDNLAP